MDRVNTLEAIWNKITGYIVPGTLGVLMIYGVGTSVLSQQSIGSEPEGEAPSYDALSGAAASDPYTPELKDIFFDTNSHLIREDAKPVLDENAEALRSEPDTFVVIEALCDSRESSASSLGIKRAESVKDYMVNQGVGPERIITANKCNIYDMQLVRSVDTERLDSRVRFIALDQIKRNESYALNR
ncbi:MAG TPA: OmpA family protein [Thermodesulfobacteriota bacterium]|nr:OmpA family protein [Thermodesulfobacteriota bacterium]